MKITFYYIRHGETLFNKRGRIQGTCDSPLSSTGIEQAKSAGKALSKVYFDKAFVSPSGRCQETISYVLAGRKLQPQIEEDLHECNFGRIEGSRFTSHAEEIRDCFQRADFKELGGESSTEVNTRIDHVFRHIREQCSDGDRVLLVSHGMFETFVIHHLLGVDFRAYEKARRKEGKNGIPNGGIMTFVYDNGKYKILSMPVEPEVFHPAAEKKTVHFYYVRHGETLFNICGRMQGWCNSPLTENGIHQACITADALHDIPFARAYSSPLERAWKTADILVSKHPGLSYEKCDGLKEVFFGDFEGVVVDSWKQEIHDRHCSKGWKDVGGESQDDVSMRIYQTMQQITAAAKDGDTILLVSHGNYYFNLLRTLFRMDRDQVLEEARSKGRQAAPNGGIARFDSIDGEFKFVDCMRDPKEFWNMRRSI